MRLKLNYSNDTVIIKTVSDDRVFVPVSERLRSIIDDIISSINHHLIVSVQIEDDTPHWNTVSLDGDDFIYDKSLMEFLRSDGGWLVRWVAIEKYTGEILFTESIDIALIKPATTPEYKLYTDGSCIGNPGRGGTGSLAVLDGKIVNGCAYTYNLTTNNRMEIMAVIHGLDLIPHGSTVKVLSDSQYVVNTMTLGWKRNKNKDLWDILDQKVAARNVTFEWVKGHNGDKYNEQVDRMANDAANNKSVINTQYDYKYEAGVK